MFDLHGKTMKLSWMVGLSVCRAVGQPLERNVQVWPLKTH